MKTNQLFVVLTICYVSLTAPISRAADITAAASGNWGDPGTWTGGVVPGTNDDADIPSGITVTVTTNAGVQYIYDAGTVTLSPNATLTITDPTGGTGTASLGTLNATASDCTVIYNCNPYWTKLCDYYNLVFDTSYWTPPTNQPPWLDFNNFSTFQGHVPMNIAGDMTLIGHVKVQQGTDDQNGLCDIFIGGKLIIGQGCAWDCSGANLTVASNAYVYGKLLDGNGAIGSNYFGGNVLVLGPATPGRAYYQPPFFVGDYTNGWFVSDVTQWAIGGSLTNNGYLGGGAGYGSIAFDGTGVITGSNAMVIPTMTVNGTYAIGNTITLTTNTPGLNGTLVFDLVSSPTNVINFTLGGTNYLWYAGNLDVINSGAAPVSGQTYQFFNSVNGLYNGNFNSVTLPPLGGGQSWVNHLLTSGSITVVGGGGGARPVIAYAINGNNLTLTWNTSGFPGFSVQVETNRLGVAGSNWVNAVNGTTSPFVTPIVRTNAPVFFRLFHP